MVNIYLTSLSYSSIPNPTSSAEVNSNLTATFVTLVNGAALQVRASYFGLCVAGPDGFWVCSSDASGLARQFQPQQDPLDLISISAKFKDGVVFSGLMYAICLFVKLLLRDSRSKSSLSLPVLFSPHFDYLVSVSGCQLRFVVR